MGSASKKRAQNRAKHSVGNMVPPDTITETLANFVSYPNTTQAPTLTTPSVDVTAAETANASTVTVATLPVPPFFAPTSSSPPTLTFHQFFQLADTDTLQKFITVAATLPETKNLAVLWNRAFKGGRIQGRLEQYQHGHKMGFEKGYEKGLEEGRKP